MNISLPAKLIVTPHTETHAYHIPHVDVTNTRTEKYIVADFTFTKNDTPVAAENGFIFAIDRKNGDLSFDSLHSLPHFADDSTKYSSYARIDAQLMRKSEVDRDCRVEYAKDQWKRDNRQYTRTANDDAGNEATNVRASTNVDHVYKETQAVKEPRSSYDIHYYEKHNPTAAKVLIDTLFLSRHKICKKCAETHHSPVYTDRLIYAKKSLSAIEVVLCHRDGVSNFKYCCNREQFSPILCSQHTTDQDQDYMLIYSYLKTNAAGIFYSHCWPRDVFDLESILKPSIRVINRACNVVVNTQLYHRYVNNYYVRISRAGCTPMTFHHDRSTMIDCMRCNDQQYSLNCRRHRLRENDNNEHRQDTSSLLLEPLLLMPELASPRHDRKIKKSTLRSERTKVIRISIAYALSFFVFASITFYVVYFT